MDYEGLFDEGYANFVSLEEQPVTGQKVLYDNIMCENISSDEEIDKM